MKANQGQARLSQSASPAPSGRSRPSLRLPLRLAILAALCALAYLPTLSIPLIEDDYPNLWESQTFGPLSALPSLMQNSVFRLRATSSWTMWRMWDAFQLNAWAYHTLSLLLHVANVWLLFGLLTVLAGRTFKSASVSGGIAEQTTEPVGAAFWAAAFFAVCQGHQEAVMWFSAINELWMFFFGMASLLCWILALGPSGADAPVCASAVDASAADSLTGRPAWRPAADLEVRPTWLWLVPSWFLFALALVSKETGVVFLPLFLLTAVAANFRGAGLPAGDGGASLPGLWDTGVAAAGPRARSNGFPWKRTALGVMPHLALAALAVASIAQSSRESFRFSDGSFSLHAPFWLIWPRGMARVLGIWGGLAIAAILWFRSRSLGRAAWFALAWTGIALAPYSFLTYSRQIPSRQTYLASAGAAMLVGMAFCYLVARFGKFKAHSTALAVALAVVVLLSNVGYIWTRKRAQFIARAAPTEQLIQVARQAQGPIWVRCFPRVPYIAEEAVELGAGRSPSDLIWSESEAEKRRPSAVYCYQEPNGGALR